MKTEFTDTHTHLYLGAFSADLDQVVARAMAQGVTRMFLPNLDSTSIDEMLKVCNRFSGNCYPMVGLHPTSVKDNYEAELSIIEKFITDKQFIAVGEIGIDLYWDKTYLKEQQIVFRQQLNWARMVELPVVIHARESFDEIFNIMDEENLEGLSGVFHSFTGNEEQAKKALSYGFYIGINGIVTFKNSGLESVVKTVPRDKLLIETDAPFLAPVPYRGKRNESSYVVDIAKKIALIYDTEVSTVAAFTTRNALELFKRVA